MQKVPMSGNIVIVSLEKTLGILKFKVIIAVKRDVGRQLAAMSCGRGVGARGGGQCRRPAGTAPPRNLFIKYRTVHQCLGTDGWKLRAGEARLMRPSIRDTAHFLT